MITRKGLPGRSASGPRRPVRGSVRVLGTA